MVTTLKTSLAVIVNLLSLTYATGRGTRDIVITNASASAGGQSDLTSRLPPLPPGFTIETGWDTSVSLNPLAVYVIAIQFMFGLSKQSWYKQVELIDSGLLLVLRTPEYNVIISTSDTHATTDLTTGLCVKALYTAVDRMATRRPGFYESTNFITVNGNPIARILITDFDHWGLPANNVSKNLSFNTPATRPNESLNFLSVTQTTPSTSTPTPTSGSVTDPNDPLYKIHYTYSSQKLPNGDIFNAALDGLALVAHYDFEGPCESITALSSSRNVVWHIGRSSLEVTYATEFARMYYLMITEVFLKEKKFMEMWIDIEYEGDKIADGYILKWDGNKGIASE